MLLINESHNSIQACRAAAADRFTPRVDQLLLYLQILKLRLPLRSSLPEICCTPPQAAFAASSRRIGACSKNPLAIKGGTWWRSTALHARGNRQQQRLREGRQSSCNTSGGELLGSDGDAGRPNNGPLRRVHRSRSTCFERRLPQPEGEEPTSQSLRTIRVRERKGVKCGSRARDNGECDQHGSWQTQPLRSWWPFAFIVSGGLQRRNYRRATTRRTHTIRTLFVSRRTRCSVLSSTTATGAEPLAEVLLGCLGLDAGSSCATGGGGRRSRSGRVRGVTESRFSLAGRP